MANTQRLGIVGGAYKTEDENLNAQECINWVPSAGGPGAKGEGKTLRSRHGHKLALLGASKTWAFFIPPGTSERFVVQYDASNSSNYALANVNTANATTLKDIATFSTLRAGQGMPTWTWAVGNSKYAMTADSAGKTNFVYSWDKDTTNFTETDVNFSIGTITYLSGYFIGSDTTSGRYYISTLEDPTLWSALDFNTAISSSDKCKRVIGVKGNLWIFGETSIEIHYNSGNPEFPFEPISGAVLDIGLVDSSGLTRVGDSIYFLGTFEGDPSVYRTQGFNLEKISNPYIDRLISEQGAGTRQWYFTNYKWKEHHFVVINAHAKNTAESVLCMVFDLSTEEWHMRTTDGGWGIYIGAASTGHPYHTYHNLDGSNGIYASGYSVNGVVQLEENLQQDYANGDYFGFTLTRTVPYIEGEDHRIFFHRLRLDHKKITKSPANVWVDYSNDDTVTWTNLGNVSLTNSTRTEWFQLGSDEGRAFRIQSDVNAEFNLTGAWVEISRGSH